MVQLHGLVAHVGEGIDRYRAEDLDVFDIDLVLFHHSRAARELWKFCNHVGLEVLARTTADEPPSDWWERGTPRRH